VSQVRNSGKLRERDFNRLLGDAVHGTEHDGKFSLESAWRKFCCDFPEEQEQNGKLMTA
jgi:hypothetical protein